MQEPGIMQNGHSVPFMWLVMLIYDRRASHQSNESAYRKVLEVLREESVSAGAQPHWGRYRVHTPKDVEVFTQWVNECRARLHGVLLAHLDELFPTLAPVALAA